MSQQGCRAATASRADLALVEATRRGSASKSARLVGAEVAGVGGRTAAAAPTGAEDEAENEAENENEDENENEAAEEEGVPAVGLSEDCPATVSRPA